MKYKSEEKYRAKTLYILQTKISLYKNIRVHVLTTYYINNSTQHPSTVTSINNNNNNNNHQIQ